MKRTVLPLMLTMTLCGWSATTLADQPANLPAQTDPPEYSLPDDPKATVISLDFQGGLTTPRISRQPTMSILADGAVQIPKIYTHEKAYTGKLSPHELQQLLRFIIEDKKFLEFDATAVKEKLAAIKDPRFKVADAQTTVIEVTVDGKTKRASQYALGIHDTVLELRQLAAIQIRLQKIMSIVKVGGQIVVRKCLERANTALAKKHPAAKRLTIDDFQHAHVQSDGGLLLYFIRIRPAADMDPDAVNETKVTVHVPVRGESEVSVIYRKRPKRDRL